jgi:hypothetical protein
MAAVAAAARGKIARMQEEDETPGAKKQIANVRVEMKGRCGV